MPALQHFPFQEVVAQVSNDMLFSTNSPLWVVRQLLTTISHDGKLDYMSCEDLGMSA